MVTWTDTLYDFTTMANTANAIANQVGTTSNGIPGWTAKTTGWQIITGVATTNSTSYFSNLAYLQSAPAQTQRIAVQPASITATGFTGFGLGYNTVTGEGLFVRWDDELSSPTAAFQRLISSSNMAPATAKTDTAINITAYSGRALGDWFVLSAIAQRDRYEVTLSVYADNGANAPNYNSTPKATATGYYTNLEQCNQLFNSYPFITGNSGGTIAGFSRVIVSSAPQLICTPNNVRPNQAIIIRLTGMNISWSNTTPFTVSSYPSGGSLLGVTFINSTNVQLQIQVPDFCGYITVSDGIAQNIIVISTLGIPETRNIYATARNANASITTEDGIVGSQFKPGNAILYSTNSDYSGSKLYLTENLVATPGYVSKSTLAGTSITIIDHTINNPRKSLGLPNGDMLVSDYGTGKIYLFQSDINVGQWSSTIMTPSALGMCLFPDPTLSGQETVLVANFGTVALGNTPQIYQFDLSGNFIKIWASGTPPFTRPSDIIFDGTSNVYIADWGPNTGAPPAYLHCFDMFGNWIETYTPTGAQNFFGITMLSDGKILCSEENSVWLYGFYPGGFQLGQIQGNPTFGGSMVDVKVAGPALSPPAPGQCPQIVVRGYGVFGSRNHIPVRGYGNFSFIKRIQTIMSYPYTRFKKRLSWSSSILKK